MWTALLKALPVLLSLLSWFRDWYIKSRAKAEGRKEVLDEIKADDERIQNEADRIQAEPRDRDDLVKRLRDNSF